jgi:hypothetical protein
MIIIVIVVAIYRSISEWFLIIGYDRLIFILPLLNQLYDFEVFQLQKQY